MGRIITRRRMGTLEILATRYDYQGGYFSVTGERGWGYVSSHSFGSGTNIPLLDGIL